MQNGAVSFFSLSLCFSFSLSVEFLFVVVAVVVCCVSLPHLLPLLLLSHDYGTRPSVCLTVEEKWARAMRNVRWFVRSLTHRGLINHRLLYRFGLVAGCLHFQR